MSSKSLIIGVSGTFGSGKDTVGDYLAKHHGFFHVSTADIVRQESMKRNNSIERSLLFETANDLRKNRGGGVLAEMAYKNYLEVADQYPNGVIISAIRSLGEIKYVKSIGGTVVFVDAPIEIRYQRIMMRKRDSEAGFTLDEFKEGEEKEMEGNPGDIQQNLIAVKNVADYHLDNSGSLEDFENQVKDALTTIKSEVQ